ncbi:MAG: GntR family transcriptional regulator [Phycisphaerales bacterium]|jgi:GntR family transcriptional regulator|nr:GntR family transcriptional regulator [Phycisphaerales bacterium]
MIRSQTTYNLVADALRRDILAGVFSPLEQMPTEQQLCERFGASRITIRHALQILEEELLIRRRQGSGTFVSPTPSRKIPILVTDYAGSVARHAPGMDRRVVQWGWAAADEVVAGQLGVLAQERILFARRVDSVEGIPVAMDDVYLVGHLAEGLEESDLVRMDFVDHWVEGRLLRVEYVSQEVEAVDAPAEIAKLLEIESGRAVLREQEILYLAGSDPVAMFVSHYRSDRIRLTSTVSWMNRGKDEEDGSNADL